MAEQSDDKKQEAPSLGDKIISAIKEHMFGSSDPAGDMIKTLSKESKTGGQNRKSKMDKAIQDAGG
jgi:hypothetical protein